MPKRSRKKLDFNEMARKIVDQATADKPVEPAAKPETAKDPAAVALGRKGGLKGGQARAANMTAAQRSASAKKAAAKRWGKVD
jgi:hypothetical protein